MVTVVDADCWPRQALARDPGDTVMLMPTSLATSTCLVVSKFSPELWFKLNFPELDFKFSSKFSVKVELNFKSSSWFIQPKKLKNHLEPVEPGSNSVFNSHKRIVKVCLFFLKSEFLSHMCTTRQRWTCKLHIMHWGLHNSITFMLFLVFTAVGLRACGSLLPFVLLHSLSLAFFLPNCVVEPMGNDTCMCQVTWVHCNGPMVTLSRHPVVNIWHYIPLVFVFPHPCDPCNQFFRLLLTLLSYYIGSLSIGFQNYNFLIQQSSSEFKPIWTWTEPHWTWTCGSVQSSSKALNWT